MPGPTFITRNGAGALFHIVASASQRARNGLQQGFYHTYPKLKRPEFSCLGSLVVEDVLEPELDPFLQFPIEIGHVTPDNRY